MLGGCLGCAAGELPQPTCRRARRGVGKLDDFAGLNGNALNFGCSVYLQSVDGERAHIAFVVEAAVAAVKELQLNGFAGVGCQVEAERMPNPVVDAATFAAEPQPCPVLPVVGGNVYLKVVVRIKVVREADISCKRCVARHCDCRTDGFGIAAVGISVRPFDVERLDVVGVDACKIVCVAGHCFGGPCECFGIVQRPTIGACVEIFAPSRFGVDAVLDGESCHKAFGVGEKFRR